MIATTRTSSTCYSGDTSAPRAVDAAGVLTESCKEPPMSAETTASTFPRPTTPRCRPPRRSLFDFPEIASHAKQVDQRRTEAWLYPESHAAAQRSATTLWQPAWTPMGGE